MIAFEKLKKILKKLVPTGRKSLNVFAIILLWAVVTMGFHLIILGVPFVMHDQVINFIAATFIWINYISSGSRIKQISSEIVAFALAEIAFISVMTLSVAFLLDFIKNNSTQVVTDELFVEQMGLALTSGFLFLTPVMNTILHSTLIYHLIRKTENKVAKFAAAVRVIYCFIGIILLYGSLYLTFLLPNNIGISSFTLLVMQITLFIYVLLMLAILSGPESEGKELRKKFDMPSYELHILAFLLTPIVITLWIISTKYGVRAAIKEARFVAKTEVEVITQARNEPDSVLFDITSRMLTVCGCYSVSLARSLYLRLTIAAVTKPNTSAARALPRHQIVK